MRYSFCVIALCSFGWYGCGAAAAQEIVHALSGMSQKVDQESRTIQVATNDGSEGTFAFPPTTSKTKVDFERDVQGRATPVASFAKVNEHIVIYYYGTGDLRTAVGVQDLGPGPFDTVEGTVTKFDKHHEQISVRDSSGKEHSFQIDPKAMADSPEGAVPANRFSASKGDNVRVIANKGSGVETALFIRD